MGRQSIIVSFSASRDEHLRTFGNPKGYDDTMNTFSVGFIREIVRKQHNTIYKTVEKKNNNNNKIVTNIVTPNHKGVSSGTTHFQPERIFFSRGEWLQIASETFFFFTIIIIN